MKHTLPASSPSIVIKRLEEFQGNDVSDLCDATTAAIIGYGSFNLGFDWVEAPTQERLEKYWRGVVLVPNREIFIGRYDGIIAASVQFVKPHVGNQVSAFAGHIEHHFVAPWARGHGLAKELLQVVETQAHKQELSVLRLSVRADQDAAISLYESCGYTRWGTLDKYEMIGGTMIAGHFYYKDL